MAPSSHKTVSVSADQAELSSGQVLAPPLAREQDPTVEEVILRHRRRMLSQRRAVLKTVMSPPQTDYAGMHSQES